MKRNSSNPRRQGFTLMETVIAIGVLAVLLTAFLAVFTPAAQGIRKAISAQEADRLAFTLERELVTLRDSDGDFATGFDKAYEWIASGDDDPLLVYQYRAEIGDSETPYVSIDGVGGSDFVVVPVVRRSSQIQNHEEELKALEGRVFVVTLKQLVFNGGELIAQDLPGGGKLDDPTPDDGDVDSGSGGGAGSASYPEAYIAFSAAFHLVPNSSASYISGKLPDKVSEWQVTGGNPIFTRNLAVRR